MSNNLSIAGLAGVLLFAGAASASSGVLDRFALATLAAGSGAVASMGLQADKSRSCRDEIDRAVRCARLNAEQNLEGVEAGHKIEITKIRRDLQKQIDSLNGEKLALQATLEADRQKLQATYEARLHNVVTSHQSAVTGMATEQRRSLSLEVRERDERLNRIAADHASTLNDLHTQISDLRSQLDKAQLDRDELLRLEYGRELHAMELQRKDDTIDSLQNQIGGLQSRLLEVSERLDDEYDEATKAGFIEASEQYEKAISELERQHDHQVQSLQNRIGQLETQLDKRKSRAAFETSLPTLASILNGRLMPLLITGNQRAGKGTSAVEAARIYGGNSDQGAVIIGFDPSEGGRENSTFGRAGIPSFKDASLVLGLMEAIEANKHTRPLTSEASAASTPRIILMIDELQTCITALDKESRERFGELFKHTYQNWLKFGIAPILLGHSPQIQNLESGGVQLLNGGHAHTAFTNILVCDVIEKFAKDNGGATPDLANYLAAYEGQFTAAYFKKGKLHGLKHPSHHGKTWSDSVPPHDKSKVRLAPCPSWFPHAIREIYAPYYDRALSADQAGATACKAGVSASAVQPVESLPGKDLHTDPRLQKWGQISEKLGFSDDELFAVIEAVEAGKNQGDTLRSALGIKSRSGNPDSAYSRGRELYQAIRSQLVEA